MKITTIFLASLMVIHILYPCQSYSDRLHFENEEISINVISKIRMVHVNTLSYSSNYPIYITDNDGFTQEKGVTGGDGTKDNPYIIEGWNIEGTSFWKMINKIPPFNLFKSLHIFSFLFCYKCYFYSSGKNKYL